MKEKNFTDRFKWLQRAKIWIGPEVINEIITRSAKIVTINVIGAFLLFISNYLLVKYFGEKIYGDYVIINVWLSVFSVICLFGMDDYFIATLPKLYLNKDREKNIIPVLIWSLKIFLLVFAIVIAFFALPFSQHLFQGVLFENKTLFFSILFELSLILILINFLRGINKIEIGQKLDKIIRPTVFIICISSVLLFNKSISLKTLLLCQVYALSIILIFLFFIVNKFFLKSGDPIVFDRSCRSNFTFLGISLLYLLSTRLDIMFLTKEVVSQEVGYYNIAARLSDLIAYPLTAFNLIMPTYISKQFYTNRKNIYLLIKKIMMVSEAIMFVALIAALFFGKEVLSLFGNNFEKSFWPFIFLSIGHLFAACASPLNGLLMISGNQRFSFISLTIYVIATFIFCSVLIPRFTSIGASMSIVIGNCVYLISLWLIIKQKVFRHQHR